MGYWLMWVLLNFFVFIEKFVDVVEVVIVGFDVVGGGNFWGGFVWVGNL